MIGDVLASSASHDYNFKIALEKQQNPSDVAKRVHTATRTPFKNLLKAFKHIALTIIKTPIALFRAAILAMRCKKAGPFLEKWSWRAIKAHCHKVNVLLKPKKPVVAVPVSIPTVEPKLKPILIPMVQEETTPPVMPPIKEKKDPDIRLERKAEKARQACLERGSACMRSTGKGIHGSQFVESLKNKKQGVFKASEPEKAWNPFSQEAYLTQGPFAKMAAERASYILARELNHPNLTVPAVKIMELNGKEGSFAVFEKGTPADKIIHEVDKKSSYTEEELHIFQIFIILDYLLGNLDRHLENWLIDWDKETKTMRAIYPIDNSNTFPNHKPPRYNIFAAKNVYKWKELKLASFPFTETMRDYLDETIIDDNIQRIIQKINGDEQIKKFYPNGFLAQQPKQDFELRTLKLKQLLLQNDKLSPKDLAQF